MVIHYVFMYYVGGVGVGGGYVTYACVPPLTDQRTHCCRPGMPRCHVSQYGGWTPLHDAADHGHIEAVKVLLAAGAKVDAADKVSRGVGVC